jgi:hypothetical protein
MAAGYSMYSHTIRNSDSTSIIPIPGFTKFQTSFKDFREWKLPHTHLLSEDGQNEEVFNNFGTEIPSQSLVLPNCDPANDFSDPTTQTYGRDTVLLSRGYEGSGKRAREFMSKMINPTTNVKIGVIGGSVSAGHGLKVVDQK